MSHSPLSTRGRRWAPVAVASAITLALGGVTVTKANAQIAPMNPYTDLEFSLDGQSWESEPQKIIGDWGCDAGDASSTPEIALPCRMGPGDEVSRTYFVRNSTDTGQPGLFTVGVGDYTVTDSAEFTVSSSISEINGTSATTGTAALIGPNAQSTATPAQRDQALSSLVLAPGEEAMVVDTVTVPRDASEAAQLQSTSPKLWIDFVAEVNDSDHDGLPDDLENQVGTDPNDPSNSLPPGKVGDDYGPHPLFPGLDGEGITVTIDEGALPPGLKYEDGNIVGTPTQPGKYEIAVTVIDENGDKHESIVTIVIQPEDEEPTGSSGTVLIPIVVGIIGAIGAIGSLPHILPWLPIGSSDGGSSDGSPGSSNGSGNSGSPDNNGNATEGSKAPQRLGAGDQARDEQVDDALKSQAGRTGSPDPSWQDENSQVRADGLANTGVNVGQMLLWALTALAAGFTLILIARRRRDDEEQEASEA